MTKVERPSGDLAGWICTILMGWFILKLLAAVFTEVGYAVN